MSMVYLIHPTRQPHDHIDNLMSHLVDNLGGFVLSVASFKTRKTIAQGPELLIPKTASSIMTLLTGKLKIIIQFSKT